MNTKRKFDRWALGAVILAIVAVMSSGFACLGTVDDSPIGPPAGTVAVHRFWAPSMGDHFYTASAEEAEWLLDNWWGVYQYEGIAFYAWPAE